MQLQEFLDGLQGRDIEDSYRGHTFRGPIKEARITGEMLEIDREWVALRLDNDSSSWKMVNGRVPVVAPLKSFLKDDNSVPPTHEDIRCTLPQGGTEVIIYGRNDNLSKPT